MDFLHWTSTLSNSLEKLYFERLRHGNNRSGSNLNNDIIKSIASGTYCREKCNILQINSVFWVGYIRGFLGRFLSVNLSSILSQKFLEDS